MKKKKKFPATSLSPEEEWVVAYHECGHVIVSTATMSEELVCYVTIRPQKKLEVKALTRMFTKREILSRQHMLARIATHLGGRAAEMLVFGEPYDGSDADINLVDDMVRQLITKHGMSKSFPHMCLDNPQLRYAEVTLAGIDREVKRITTACFRRATDILWQYRTVLHAMAVYLVLHKEIIGDELDRFLKQIRRSKRRIRISKTRDNPADRLSLSAGICFLGVFPNLRNEKSFNITRRQKPHRVRDAGRQHFQAGQLYG